MKNIKKIFLIVGFFTLLFVSNLFLLLDENTQVDIDKGEILFPTFDFPHVGRFILDFDFYHNRRFAGKKTLLQLYSNLQYYVLKSSPFYNAIIVGKDEWFFNNYNDALYASMGLHQFDNKQLDKILTNVQEKRERLNKQGIKYYLCIAPDKHSVYGEFLPLHFQKRAKTKLEQTKSHLLKNQFELIDLKDNFSNYDNLRLFHKTDTHWNNIGAFLGYKRLMQSIQKDFDNITTFELSDFKIDTLIKSVSTGDLTNQIQMEEEYLSLIPNKKYKAVELEKKLQIKVPYYYEYRYKGTGNLKVVVFRDSFCVDMIPFLREYFGETVFVWSYDLNEEIIKKEKPDIVIEERIERTLHSLTY